MKIGKTVIKVLGKSVESSVDKLCRYSGASD